ncbi:hypothetical protein ACFZBU_38820 [Embleya sp. NPDC008237]|uniref:hypothetical protein n=1 Tax=Embleya sp. NPDC008237 TaxID=3363978 RepID=UPI0036E84792
MRSLGPGDGVAGWIMRFAGGEERVHVTFDDIPGEWVYEVEGRIVAGTVGITRLTIAPRDLDNPRSLTRAIVAGTPIDTVIERLRGALKQAWDERPAHLAAAVRKHQPKQGRSHSPEHFLQVAWRAVEGDLDGRSPRRAITDTWNVDGDTATRWLAEARKLGYLPPGPIQPAPGTDTWVKATGILEARIFEKALHDALANPDATPIAELLATAMTTTSPLAEQLRNEAFLHCLVDLAKGDPTDPVHNAAAALLAAFQATSPTEENSSDTGDHRHEPEDTVPTAAEPPPVRPAEGTRPARPPGRNVPADDGREVTHRIVENGLTYAYSGYTRLRQGRRRTWVESRQPIRDDIHAGHTYYVVTPDGTEIAVYVDDDRELAATDHGSNLLDELPEADALPGRDRAALEMYREHSDLYRAMRGGLR